MIVTVDGLLPETYLKPDAHGLRIPNLRALMQEGAYADDTRSVFLPNTVPAHASIATGVTPSKHGIVNNRLFDPLAAQELPYSYAEDIRATPLWELARRAGLHTAAVSWPTTVGASIDWLVPPFSVARHPQNLKVVRALSTPGLLASVQQQVPDLYARFVPPEDAAIIDVIAYVLRTHQPELSFVHLWQVDEAQHRDGLWSPSVIAAIENTDVQLGRLRRALDEAGLSERTLLVVASDHGFADVTRLVHPGVLLREAGLLAVDEKGKVTSYRAALASWGGIAQIHARAGEDVEALERELHALFDARAKQPGSDIARTYGRAELAKRGGDPEAVFAVEPEAGVAFGMGLERYETAVTQRGMHGYDPEHSDMRTSLLWKGPNVQPGLRHGAQLLDIAPTVAAWLGMKLEAADGRVLQ